MYSLGIKTSYDFRYRVSPTPLLPHMWFLHWEHSIVLNPTALPPKIKQNVFSRWFMWHYILSVSIGPTQLHNKKQFADCGCHKCRSWTLISRVVKMHWQSVKMDTEWFHVKFKSGFYAMIIETSETHRFSILTRVCSQSTTKMAENMVIFWLTKIQRNEFKSNLSIIFSKNRIVMNWLRRKTWPQNAALISFMVATICTNISNVASAPEHVPFHKRNKTEVSQTWFELWRNVILVAVNMARLTCGTLSHL